LIYSEADDKYFSSELAKVHQILVDQIPIKKSLLLDNKDVVMQYRLSKYGWHILSVAHYSSINKTLMKEKKRIFVLAALVLIVIILVTIFLSNIISKRLKRLYKKMIKVQNGNLEITDRITGNDEIGEIDKYFSECIERIKLLIEQNYIAKLEKRDAELVALQLQINPHFLYNTLESINYIAEIYECSEISLISQKLGQMFRYILNKDFSEFVPLYQDLKHVMNYMEIQNIRFSNKFNIVTEINQELMNAKIIKFTLQPIIENSVKYAFSGRSGGTISISANTELSDLFITIQDNGIGIEPAYLEEVNKVINDMSFNLAEGYQRSIGLRNVNLRIKKTFGEEYGIQVFSKPNEGTRVICKLPYSEIDFLEMHTNYGLVN
jgi:two-component system sensor histidine kinase YesM